MIVPSARRLAFAAVAACAIATFALPTTEARAQVPSPAPIPSASPSPLPSVGPSAMLSAAPSPESSASPSSESSPSPNPTSSASPSVSPSPSATPTPLLPAAGVVPAEIEVDFGGLVSSAFALARIDASLTRAAQMQPGATIDIHGIALPNGLHPGDRLDVVARVKIAGGDAFADALGTTTVHLRDDLYPTLDPQLLLYSDDPERLDAAADGVLFHANVDAGRSARLYAYHVSDSPGRKLYLALRSAGGAESLQMLGYTAGPENAFEFVGHRATLQYLLERGAGESVIVDLPGDAPLLLPLGGRALRPGDLVASIYDLRALDGGAFSVSVVAVSGGRDPLEVLAGGEIPGDGHGRRGEYSLVDVPPLALDYTVGAAEPAPFAIGAPTIANLRPGGRALGGDYGVLRGIALQLNNPTQDPANVYFFESPAGGNASTSLWWTSDPAPTEIACARGGPNRYGIKAFALAPGETRTVTGEYMTDGTSYFPLLFGLTATPPSPPPGPYSPDACTPKTPPPPPAPSTSPSPNASPSLEPSAIPNATPIAVPMPSATS